MTKSAPSIDIHEVEKFSLLAAEWWDETGKFKPLHCINPIRLGYIRDKVIEHFNHFEGISFVDIGCGGGLISEPLARLGGNVTGLDASEKNIRTASLHAVQMGVEVNYLCQSAEELAASGQQFDVVLAMEVVEHVADVESFLTACCQLVKPGGILFVSTLNKTVKSFLTAIIGAEYILRWLPRGTHNWKKFLPPSHIARILRHNGISMQEMKGFHYHILDDKWSLSSDVQVNYIALAKKPPLA